MATDPLCAGRHPDLVTLSVIADHGAGGMRPVRLVITGKRRIEAARIGGTVVNGIVPVIIVIGVLTIPTAVMRLKRVMRPANAGIRARYNNILPCKTQCPYLGRMRIIDARFNGFGSLKMWRGLVDCLRFRKMIQDLGIAFYPRHVRPRS